MEKKAYREKLFAIYSPLINQIVGRCSGFGIEDVLEEDDHEQFIEITEEEFEQEAELTMSQLKDRPILKPKIKTIIVLED